MPNAHWDVMVGLSLLDTEITDATEIIEVGACGDCDGNSLPFAPEVSTSAIVTYRRPASSGEMVFTTEHVYRSEMFGGPDNIAGRDGRLLGRSQFPARLPQRRPGTLTLWVENAFDEEYFERGWENADENNQFGYGLFNELVWPARPRTVGMTFGKEWE